MCNELRAEKQEEIKSNTLIGLICVDKESFFSLLTILCWMTLFTFPSKKKISLQCMDRFIRKLSFIEANNTIICKTKKKLSHTLTHTSKAVQIDKVLWNRKSFFVSINFHNCYCRNVKVKEFHLITNMFCLHREKKNKEKTEIKKKGNKEKCHNKLLTIDLTTQMASL